MSSIEGQFANIKTIVTNELNIGQSTTDVKWNPSRRHPDISLLNAGVTAKLNSVLSKSKAILANKAYTVGVNTDTIKFDIHRGSSLYFGLATDDRNLTSLILDNSAVGKRFDVEANTILKMNISRTLVSTSPDVYSTKLRYEYKGVISEVNTDSYNSLVMYPWMADDIKGNGFSVEISRNSVLKSYIDGNGDVVFSTVDDSGISRPIRFETGSNETIFDNLGFSGLPSITYDILESSTAAESGVSNFNMQLRVRHPSAPGLSNPGVLISESAKITTTGGVDSVFIENSSGPLIIRESGGVDVTIDSTGLIFTPGAISAISMTSNSVSSNSGNPLSLTENGGLGITVEDLTGDVTLSNRLSVGNGGNLTSDSVLASFNTNTQNQALVLPTVSDVTVNTIPALQQVIGMIVYSIADNKFMGFTSGGWVGLSI